MEREIIRPLTEHKKFRKLLRYLDAIMQCEGSPKNAASRMGVAAHTARTYRGTIEQATGRVLRQTRRRTLVRPGLACGSAAIRRVP